MLPGTALHSAQSYAYRLHMDARSLQLQVC